MKITLKYLALIFCVSALSSCSGAYYQCIQDAEFDINSAKISLEDQSGELTRQGDYLLSPKINVSGEAQVRTDIVMKDGREKTLYFYTDNVLALYQGYKLDENLEYDFDVDFECEALIKAPQD